MRRMESRCWPSASTGISILGSDTGPMYTGIPSGSRPHSARRHGRLPHAVYGVPLPPSSAPGRSKTALGSRLLEAPQRLAHLFPSPMAPHRVQRKMWHLGREWTATALSPLGAGRAFAPRRAMDGGGGQTATARRRVRGRFRARERSDGRREAPGARTHNNHPCPLLIQGGAFSCAVLTLRLARFAL